MATDKKKQEAHSDCLDWGAWLRDYLDHSSLKYRICQYEAVISGEPHSLWPKARMPEHIARVDRVVRNMERELRAFVEFRYIGGGTEVEKMQAWAMHHARPEKHYWDAVDSALDYIAENI